MSIACKRTKNYCSKHAKNRDVMQNVVESVIRAKSGKKESNYHLDVTRRTFESGSNQMLFQQKVNAWPNGS